MTPRALEFRQSARQHFLHRMYQAFGQAASVLLGAVAGGILGVPQPLVGFSVGLSVSVPVLTFLWLAAFNSGRTAVPTFVLRLTARGIEVRNLEMVSVLPWDHVRSVRVSWHPWRQVRVKATKGRGLRFGYYALDREQRRRLHQELREGTFRQLATREAARDDRHRLRQVARDNAPQG